MSKSAIKFYIIPGIIALIIIIVLLLIPINKKNNNTEEKNTVSPTVIINLPTKILTPDNGSNKTISPTLIPPQPFTGADVNQELPQDLKSIGEQKTALRRLTPLTLPFGTIEFDYENDIFLVQFSKQEDQNSQVFSTWLKENYPALTQDKFAFR